jgi:hypothetical protein
LLGHPEKLASTGTGRELFCSSVVSAVFDYSSGFTINRDNCVTAFTHPRGLGSFAESASTREHPMAQAVVVIAEVVAWVV